MYCYGGAQPCGGYPYPPAIPTGGGYGAAIILVLFILLVIVIGSRSIIA